MKSRYSLEDDAVGRVYRVIVAENHSLARKRLFSGISRRMGLEVAGEARDGEEAVASVLKLKPDLIVMELALPKLGGLVALREIKKRCPATKALVLTNDDSKEGILAAFKAGADGYLLKSTDVEELFFAIDKVLHGKIYLCKAVLAIVEQVIEQQME